MKQEIFEIIVNEMLSNVKDVLVEKAKEYVLGPDRLSAFKLEWMDEPKLNSKQVLWGALVKHLNSLNDMCNYKSPEDDVKLIKAYKEKITDSINYLIILYAIIIEYKIDDVERKTYE